MLWNNPWRKGRDHAKHWLLGHCCASKIFFSVFAVAEKRLNTEVTETLRVLCVEALEAQRTRRNQYAQDDSERLSVAALAS